MTDLVSIPLFRALGWTLLHSLWQGALIGLLAALALGLTRQCSAVIRYRLAFGALTLLIVSFAATLHWVSRSDGPLTIASDGLVVSPVFGGLGATGWLFLVRSTMSPWIPWLLVGWMLGFTFRLVQLGRAMAWLYGPGLRSLQPPPTEWQTRFESLRQRLQVKCRVALGVSDQVDSLVVLGWLKPVVLIPAAALLVLSPEALEAVLVHELEHVRRMDFLANVIQSFAEALLFYHPAVWWLSRRIRQEREHCCDDAAVQACGDPILYASALARLEELRCQPHLIPDLAPAASGGRLMSRIKRILRPNLNQDIAQPWMAFAPALLLLAGLAAASLAANTPPAPRSTPVAAHDAPGTEASGGGPVEMNFSQIKIKHQPAPPDYPADAKASHIQGTVVVIVTIDAEGKVISAVADSGPEQLQSCAVEYAKAWEFKPAKVKGKPVTARFKLTMPFRLR